LTAENGGARNGRAVNRSILAHLRSAGDAVPLHGLASCLGVKSKTGSEWSPSAYRRVARV